MSLCSSCDKNGVCFSLAATLNPSLCCTSLNNTPYLRTNRHRAYKLFSVSLHGVGTGGQPVTCDLPRARHSVSFSHGTAASRRRHTRRSIPATHDKPASYRCPKAKKRMQTQKEAKREEALLKHEPANPSEDCIARLLEQQPLRLQNSAATFHCAPQETNAVPHEASRMEREKSFLHTKGNSKRKFSNGDVKLNSGFSVKLLNILASFKRNNQFSDEKLTGVTESQPLENKSGEDSTQGHSKSNIFFSFASQRQPTVEMERQPRTVDEPSIEGTQLAAPAKDERSDCGMLSSSREEILDSPLECKGPKGNRPALEELGFTSESSDDDIYKGGNRQAIDELESVSLQHKARQMSKPAPASSGRGSSHVFPWHLSRSTGSRSNPSRSSIPGLRSKYSKPDPNAKQQMKKPLQLLSNFEEETDMIDRFVIEAENEEDVSSYQIPHKQPETGLKELERFDWWDSDDEDDFKCRLSTSTKLPAVSKVESSPTNHKLKPQLNREAGNSGSLRSLENSHKAIDEENISFELKGLDKKDDVKAEDKYIFEWSDSDGEDDSNSEDNFVTEEKSLKLKCDDSDHEFDTENSASPNPVSFQIQGNSTWPNMSMATSTLSSFSDQVSTGYDRADYLDLGSNSFHNRNLSVRVTQKANNGELYHLPASVKFVETPSWKGPIFPDFPFEIKYSYSETPKVPILGFRDHSSPFTPRTMDRPWTGGAHIKPRRHLKSIESFSCAVERKKAFELTFNRKGRASKQLKSREEILGNPLMEEEIISLVQNCHEEYRQVNLGRDGLTHNMIHLIHSHWKKRPVCKIKCRGVPTMDMDNVCFHIEDKTGGQIIYRCGGVVYVFRGRNYSFKDRPVVPIMLFRPASPVYPKLVPQAPGGLTIDEAHQLRILGQKVKPLLELRKNALLLDLVRDVRDAFQVDELVSLNYAKVNRRDYRKIGAKLMELVPCILLSLRNNRIVLWKGRDSKSASLVGPESCAESARLDGEPTDVEGYHSSEDDGCSFSEPDERSVDDSVGQVSKKSTPLHHEDKDFVSEANLMNTVDLNSERRHAKIWPSNNADTMVLVAGNDCRAVGMARWDRRDQSRLPPDGLEELWEVALSNGMAVEIKDIDMDADLILHKVTLFSEIAPAASEYTNRLVNRLRLFGLYKKTQKPFVVPLTFIKRKERIVWRKKWPKKSRTEKRASRSPKIEVPLRKGLQTDNLVKKLLCV